MGQPGSRSSRSPLPRPRALLPPAGLEDTPAFLERRLLGSGAFSWQRTSRVAVAPLEPAGFETGLPPALAGLAAASGGWQAAPRRRRSARSRALWPAPSPPVGFARGLRGLPGRRDDSVAGARLDGLLRAAGRASAAGLPAHPCQRGSDFGTGRFWQAVVPTARKLRRDTEPATAALGEPTFHASGCAPRRSMRRRRMPEMPCLCDQGRGPRRSASRNDRGAHIGPDQAQSMGVQVDQPWARSSSGTSGRCSTAPAGGLRCRADGCRAARRGTPCVRRRPPRCATGATFWGCSSGSSISTRWLATGTCQRGRHRWSPSDAARPPAPRPGARRTRTRR